MRKNRKTTSKAFLLLLLNLLFSGTFAYSQGNSEQGEVTFNMFCMACHHLENKVVGPSLIEIAHLYRKEPEGIVKWSMNPGEKRKDGIRMPPMSHVGEQGLTDVAAYILKVTEGKVFKGNKAQVDPYATFKKPRIQRMFMPDAGPAAIAVSVNENLHFCWDAGTCQLRYIWKGNYIDPWPVLRGNGNGLVKILGEVFVKIEQGNPFDKNAKPKFHGYKKVNGLPVFSYTLDQMLVQVSFESTQDGHLKVHYQCDSDHHLKFTPLLTKGNWSSKQGQTQSKGLKLSSQEAKNFTVTYKAGDNS